MPHPDWYYDDLRQVGLDFEDPTLVERYDRAQNTSLAGERQLVAKLAPPRGGVAAEFGCGTGALAVALAEVCGTVHAIDISASMLAVAERRAARAGQRNVQPQRAGFLSFTLPDASLDLATSKYAFHHLPDFWKAAALARLRMALKPGGRLYLADVVFACDPTGIPAAVEGWIGWMTRETGYSRDEVATHVRDEHSTFDWILTGLVERAGFRILDFTHDGTVYGELLAEKL